MKAEPDPKALRQRALTAEKKLRELKAKERLSDHRDDYKARKDKHQSRGLPQLLIEAMHTDYGYETLPCTIGLTSGLVLTGHPRLLDWWRRSDKQHPIWLTLSRITFQHPVVLKDIENWDMEINTAQIAWVAWSKSITKWVEDDYERGPLELPKLGPPQQLPSV